MKSFVCITGAAGGLGKAFSVECAARGWNLFLTDLSSQGLSSLSKGLTSTYGIKVITYPCDLTDHVSREKLFDYVQNNGMHFWMLINNAGIDYEGAFADRTDEQIRNILRLNIEANLEMTYGVLRFRDTAQAFRVVNVSSLAAYYPMPLKAMYAASKRFVLNFSMALREEIKPIGGTVTALCPAGMPTNKECIQAIDAQGFAGWVTTKNVGFVAARTIDHVLKGHAVYIPGILNRLLKFFGALVPSTLIAHVIYNRWNSAQKKRTASKTDRVQYEY